ncbi:MAG: Hpt domain-containing protein [Bdellovibrionota bacterium]
MHETIPLLDMKAIDSILTFEKKGLLFGFLQKQLDHLRNEVPEHLSLINDAVLEKDFKSLSQHTHKLNGFAAIIGAQRVRHLCIEIERLGDESSVSVAKEIVAQLEDALTATIDALQEIVSKA